MLSARAGLAVRALFDGQLLRQGHGETRLPVLTNGHDGVHSWRKRLEHEEEAIGHCGLALPGDAVVEGLLQAQVTLDVEKVVRREAVVARLTISTPSNVTVKGGSPSMRGVIPSMRNSKSDWPGAGWNVGSGQG